MKINRLQKVLIGILTLVIVSNLLFTNARIANKKNEITLSAYGTFSMLKYTLVDAPISSFSNFFDFVGNYYQIYNENLILRKQISNLASAQAQLNEAQRQIAELQALNELATVSSDYYVKNATIINRSLESYNNILTINLGANDGIMADLAVITPSGLIGKVITVNDNNSVVKLLSASDSNNKVSVKIERSDSLTSDAILDYYDQNSHMYHLILLDTNVSILPDSRVVTSGMGGVFPSGILVGYVDSAQEIENEVSMNVYVRPAVDFSNLNYVQVVFRGDENAAD